MDLEREMTPDRVVKVVEAVGACQMVHRGHGWIGPGSLTETTMSTTESIAAEEMTTSKSTTSVVAAC